MIDIELVEKLREKANVSYEDAKTALDQSGGDLLEALIQLEKQGKVDPPVGGTYTSRQEEQGAKAVDGVPQNARKRESFTDMWDRFVRWCGKLLHAGNTNHFQVRRYDSEIISVPVTVLVLLLMFAFWVTVPLLVVGLFLNCRYSFSRVKTANINVNEVMDSAANAAEAIKNEVRGYAQDQKHDDGNNGEK